MKGQKTQKSKTTTATPPPTGPLLDVPLDDILVVSNVRKEFDQDGLKELADSIRAQGVLEPILVRPVKGARYIYSIAPANDKKQLYGVLPMDDASLPSYEVIGRDAAERMEKVLARDHYQLVAGERRYRAAKLAGLKTIPAVVRSMSVEEAELAQATENLQRRDLLPIEEADAYRVISKHAGIGTVEELAARVGKQVRYVAERLKLLDLSEKAQRLLREGKLPLGHALAISKLGPETQDEVLQHTVFGKTWNGSKQVADYDKPVPLKNLEQHIDQNVYRKLSSAPWQMDWAPAGYKNGACATCPFNSANDSVLFADAKGAGRCTNAVSFEEKMRVWIRTREEEIKQETGKAALHIWPENYHVDQYDVKNYKLPADTLGRMDFKAIVKKEEPCEFARHAVVVQGAERGQTRLVCADRKCKVHFAGVTSSVGSSARSQKTDAEALRERQIRKQELFDLKVNEPVRRVALAQATKAITWKALRRDHFNVIALAHYARIQSHTQRIVGEVFKAATGIDLPSAHIGDHDLLGHQKRVNDAVAKMTDDQLAQLMLLCAVGHFGENEYMRHRSDQKALRAFVEQWGVAYAVLDAEERLKQSSKKYREAHEAHLEAVRAGKADVKDAPKVYGDPPTNQKALPEGKARAAASASKAAGTNASSSPKSGAASSGSKSQSGGNGKTAAGPVKTSRSKKSASTKAKSASAK